MVVPSLSKISVEDYRSISVLTGKALIPCPGPIKYEDPFENDDSSYPAFIVGQDATGEPVTDKWDEKGTGRENALRLSSFAARCCGSISRNLSDTRYAMANSDVLDFGTYEWTTTNRIELSLGLKTSLKDSRGPNVNTGETTISFLTEHLVRPSIPETLEPGGRIQKCPT